MCDYCDDTLGSLCLSHSIKDCPLRKGSYCSICASYGHSIKKCKQELNSGPNYLEQLVPSQLLSANGIKSITPIDTSLSSSSISEEHGATPLYLEQLIPIAHLQRNGIRSYTPIVSTQKKVWHLKPEKACIDMPDDPKAIRAFLKANNSLPEKDNRSKNKYKDQLELFARRMNSTIHYIPKV